MPITEFSDAYEQWCGTRGYSTLKLDKNKKLLEKGFGVTIEERDAKGYSGVRWKDPERERPTAGVNLASFDGNVTKFFVDQECVVTQLQSDIIEQSAFRARLDVRDVSVASLVTWLHLTWIYGWDRWTDVCA